MQTRFLRDRLQRCRGELSQIIGMVHDLEQAEAPEHNGPGAMRPGWLPSERYSGRVGALPAAGGRQHQTHQVAMLERIRQAADRCAATLSEVEREVDILTGSGRETGRPTDGWRSPVWSAQAPNAWSAPAEAAHGYTARGDYARSTGGFAPFPRYGRDQAAPTQEDSSFFSRPDFPGRSAYAGAATVPASQQGGFDYGYAAAGRWQNEPVAAGRRSGRY